MADDPAIDVAELRSRALAKRDSLDADEIRIRSRIVLGKVAALGAIGKARTIGCYLPLGSEVDIRAQIADWLELGRRVAVTVATADGPRHALLTDLDAVVPSPLDGRPAPPPDDREWIATDELDVLLVPGSAFDSARRRLGYGDPGDTTLIARAGCTRIAPIYDLQLVRAIPDGADTTVVDIVVGETVLYEA